MAGNGRLNRRQRRFVTALVSAPTIEAAAEAAGIGERTGYRYLEDPLVKRELAGILDQALAQVTSQAVDGMTKALDTLARIHQDPSAPTGSRVSAARAILDAAPKLREAYDLAARVAALEERILERGK